MLRSSVKSIIQHHTIFLFMHKLNIVGGLGKEETRALSVDAVSSQIKLGR